MDVHNALPQDIAYRINIKDCETKFAQTIQVAFRMGSFQMVLSDMGAVVTISLVIMTPDGEYFINNHI